MAVIFIIFNDENFFATHEALSCGQYGARAALAGVSFTVSRGELFALLGPNGGGKTTLFKILSTLLPATSGDIEVFGQSLSQNPHAIRSCLGVVFQHPSLDSKLT